jgi:hypothetical protein
MSPVHNLRVYLEMDKFRTLIASDPRLREYERTMQASETQRL